MASMAHRIHIHILLNGRNLDPMLVDLAGSSFAVLLYFLGMLHPSCQALLRPLHCGFAVTAGGSCSSSAPGDS